MKCSTPTCELNATIRVSVLGMEPAAVCDDCASRLHRTYARACNVELLEPPPPPELLSPDEYRDVVMSVGVLAARLSTLGPVLPRLLASLRAHLSEGGPAAPMIALVEALEPVANLAIRLSRNGLPGRPVSVEKPPRGRC